MDKLERTGGKSSGIAKNALLAHHPEADSLLINAALGHYQQSERAAPDAGAPGSTTTLPVQGAIQKLARRPVVLPRSPSYDSDLQISLCWRRRFCRTAR